MNNQKPVIPTIEAIAVLPRSADKIRQFENDDGELQAVAIPLGLQMFHGDMMFVDLYVNSGNAEKALEFFAAPIAAGGKAVKVCGEIHMSRTKKNGKTYTNYNLRPTKKCEIVDRPKEWGDAGAGYVDF